MPREKSGLFDQAEYIKEYQRENRFSKKVTFNRKNPDDMEMVAWLDSRPEGIVQYLKWLIRDDMERWNVIERASARTEAVEKEIGEIRFPAVDNFRDEDACKVCMEEGHRILVKTVCDWEVRIDVDTRKVLTVRNINKIHFD
jgi:hypothetical protein